jgi:hypothetical protein
MGRWWDYRTIRSWRRLALCCCWTTTRR